MAKLNRVYPDYIFESSWEVCNKVGGIYTVLSTRANTLQNKNKDHVIFLGPDCWGDKKSPFFIDDQSLFPDWRKELEGQGLKVKIGRWDIPGQPIALLVGFNDFFAQKNELFGKLWELAQVDSLHAYGDYDESAMFSFAVAKVVESFYRFHNLEDQKVIFHANEWQTGFAALFLQKMVPQIATIFTTHATCIGRSIAGNMKPLYEYLPQYNGDQMARELNMESKHSIEKQTAWHVDCFTTVSDITAHECEELLDKKVDFVLPNGFEDDFVPKGAAFNKKRKAARGRLLKIANALTGDHYDDDTLIVSTSGRYEFRNKGIDAYVESMNRLRLNPRTGDRKVVAFVEVPGWTGDAREDLKARLAVDQEYDTPLEQPVLTHWLNNMDQDNLLGQMNYLDFRNRKEDRVKLIFIPCYLIGDDGIVNLPYYDMVLGNDLCIYPSYYEPWGYTPLEAVAFKVPCITTDLAGFGLWANTEKGSACEIEDGVKVVHRTDYNFGEVADSIRDTVLRYMDFTAAEKKKARENAGKLSKKALWKNFIKYYEDAYDFAIREASHRK